MTVKASAEVELPFIAEAVGQSSVISLLYHLESMGPHVGFYGEIALGISNASNQDPLFPAHEAGCEATACILAALAYSRSRFHQSLWSKHLGTMGLYQIQPPTVTVPAKMLLLPKDASYVALDLVRYSFRKLKNQPVRERLTLFYAAQGETKKVKAIQKGMEVMLSAEQLMGRFYPRRPNMKLLALPPATTCGGAK